MIIINVIILVRYTAVHIDNPRNRHKSKDGLNSLVPKVDERLEILVRNPAIKRQICHCFFKETTNKYDQ